ncbi:hypothetical protein FSP39_004688 [Pinctada imbricata]|uniref:Uncharacterized protein n=1 Tax=Pinctada imbricata TaxID=66713 RepID=A0AA88YAX2_PINIB|nr:hypothetical protein FSP39_004688 [Pinctada imbricata]
MARGTSDALFKKNTKLESYLKRTLPEEAFDRVRAYESCIIVSEKENKAFKYCVLDDEYIYLTENPPKNPQDIQAVVSLKDITSVEMVNDFPDFLSGEERDNTQHLRITHWTSVNAKRRSFRKPKKSPRSGSVSDLHGDRSNASTPLDFTESSNLSEDYGYITQSMSSLQVSRPESRGSISSSQGLKAGGREIKTGSIGKKKKRMSDSMEESVLKSLKEELEDGQLEDIEETDGTFSSSYLSMGLKSGRKTSTTSAKKETKSTRKKSEDTTSQTGSVRQLPSYPPSKPAFDLPASNNDVVTKDDKNFNALNDEDESQKPNFCSYFLCFRSGKVSCGRDESVNEDAFKKPIPVDTETMNSLNKQNSTDKRDLFIINKPEINIDATSESGSRQGFRGSVPSLHDPAPPSRRSSITTLRGQSRAGTPALENEATRSGSNLGFASMSDYGGSVNGLSMLGVEGVSERRKVVLNIYLLNIHSPMLMLIRSAWSNYLIRCTLNIDTVSKSNVIRSGQIQRERMEMLFNQLKRELLNPANGLEDNFTLLVELRNSTLKNFAIKKLFWKNSDMFVFMVRQLQRYLPKSPVNVNTEHGRVQRADELEMIVTLVEILIIMFRETEIIPHRIMTLKADRGKPLFDLLRVLVCFPEIPEKDAAPSSKGSDEEIQNLIAEFSRVGMTAVFEIFLMAQQANWSYSEGSFFNISWIMKMFEEMKTTEPFVEKVLTSLLKFIGPTQTEPLTPKEAVLLYTQFSVLQIFLQYSPRMAAFIRNNYLEEFKYFIQVPIVMKKIPKSYPIGAITVTLIDSVTSRVLDTVTRHSSRKISKVVT